MVCIYHFSRVHDSAGDLAFLRNKSILRSWWKGPKASHDGAMDMYKYSVLCIQCRKSQPIVTHACLDDEMRPCSSFRYDAPRERLKMVLVPEGGFFSPKLCSLSPTKYTSSLIRARHRKVAALHENNSLAQMSSASKAA